MISANAGDLGIQPWVRGRYRGLMLALLLVAISLGLSNFTAIGIEVSGIDARTRLCLRAFETTTPILGLRLGRNLAGTLSRAAHSISVASEAAYS